MDITKLKVLEIKNKLENKEIICKEVVEAYFKNIEEKSVNAFISLDREAAIKEAERIDEKIENGDTLGSLGGAIISLKDNIMTKDFKTTAGSKFLEDFHSPYDATVVRLIKEEDGIIIGKNTMDEFGIESGHKNEHLGGIKAVAEGEVTLAIGSDTDGSLRRDAAQSGLVGFKPTYGRISRHGLIAISDSMDQIGIISKNVEDTIHIYKAISKQDELDPSTKDIGLDLQELKGSLEGVKVGFAKDFLPKEIDEKLIKEFDNTIEKFTEHGAIVEEVFLGNIKYSEEAHKIIMNSDISTNLARFDGLRYGYRAKDYTSLDELYINSRTDGLGDEVKKRILLGTYLLSNGEVDYYKKALKIRGILIQEFNDVFKKVDILITPVTDVATMIVNITGLCGISIPSSVGENSTGIQFIGNRFKERDILNAALAYEGMVK